MQNEGIAQSISRAIKRGDIKGRYDSINKTPLRLSVIYKKVKNSTIRSISVNEPILHIDIPKGYHIPIKPRNLSCSFSSAECTFTSQLAAKKNLNLGYTYENSGITFTTDGSYIEIGLGAYLKAHYDKNLFTDSVFDFTFAQSAYFESNMVISIKGELTKDWSTDLKIINDFDVELVQPHTLK